MREEEGARKDDFLTQLRAADPDRYLATLYAPERHRAALAALYLFNWEIAAIRSRVSEPIPGEIRLQWWRDTISAGMPTGNPVGDALIDLIGLYGLPQSAFLNLLEARVFDLYNDPIPDRNAFEGYAGETASVIFHMAAHILNEGAVADVADAAGHAGVARCVAEVLTALPLQRGRGQVYLPGDLLAAVGLDAPGFLAADDKAACDQAVAAFVALGRDHLANAEAAIAPLAVTLKAAFLPLATVEPVFKRAGRAKSAVLHRPVALSALTRQWKMLRRALAMGR